MHIHHAISLRKSVKGLPKVLGPKFLTARSPRNPPNRGHVHSLIVGATTLSRFSTREEFERVEDVGDKVEDVSDRVEVVEFNPQRRFAALDTMVENRTARLEDLTDELKQALQSLKNQDYPRQPPTSDDVPANDSRNKNVLATLEKISAATTSISQIALQLHRGVCQIEHDTTNGIGPRTEKIHRLLLDLCSIADISELPSRLNAMDHNLHKLEKGLRAEVRLLRSTVASGLHLTGDTVGVAVTTPEQDVSRRKDSAMQDHEYLSAFDLEMSMSVLCNACGG